MRWLLLAVGIMLWSGSAQAYEGEMTVNVSRSVLAIHDTVVLLGSITLDNTWEPINGISFFPGIHLATLKGKGERNDASIFGFDLYAKIKGGPLWSRYGIGWGVFVDRNMDYDTPWDFRLSWQTGFQLDESLGITIDLNHWSNARGGAENLGLSKLWPKANDGGDMVGLGLAYTF